MELAHGLLLNEEAYKDVPANKKPTFIYEWLRFLHKVLGAAQRADIKDKQEKLIDQLTAQILTGPGPPTRKLIGKCLTLVYNLGGSYTSYKTVNKCNEIARNKDDSPSYLQIRLSAIDCLGSLYEDMGPMMGNVMQETIHILTKGLKNAESQTRAATIDTLRRVMVGLGASASICHRDIYKVSKNALIDRSMHVRTAAAECLRELSKQATFVYFFEFESLCTQCIRSLEGSSYEVRCSVAKLLGYVAAESQRVRPTNAKEKPMSLVDVLNVLMGGFVQTASSRGLGSRDNKHASAHSVRIGVTMAYVEMARYSGPEWLERFHATFIKHVLELVLHPKCISVHVEAVYSRRCVSFILRSTIGRLLGEKQQRTAARELCHVISQQMNAVDMSASENVDAINNQHVLVCAANELGCIVQSLGTSAAPLVAEAQSNILQPVVGILLHPTQCARLAAAWCLRCIATALPSQLTPLIDKCATSIRNMKSSREAVSGYSSALAALLGAVSESPMGIPHSKGSIVFGVAEELLRTANKNGRLALYKTQAGWILLGALMTLGPSVVKHHLSRLLQLWKSVFPRSMRELEQERQKGDSFTWQLTLEARSGALCAMRSFVANCGELLTDDVTRKLMVPLESAMAMMGIIPFIINTHGLHLKASAAMVRLRLYDILALLPPKSYEGSFHALLRELVAEFTLTDNPANTTTSLLRSLCHQDDSVLLGYWMQDTDQSFIEDQMQTNSVSGSGALEHDATSVYLPAPKDNTIPGPLPLGVSVIDAAIALFGLAFSHVAHKHRVQMLRHFGECVKQSVKNVGRQRAIQINVFTALICALKGLSENKLTLGKGEVINAATALVLEALASTDSVLRCAAGEAVGRMAQVSDEGGFVSKIALMCFEKLKTARDVISRTGHSLALGCVHRYVGGMGAAQHLRTSVGILLALAQDHNSPEVQVWALHALALIVDAFGPMFRAYVEPALQAIISLLLNVPLSHANVHRCLGRCLSAIITTLGPELQGTASAISSARSNCLTCCSIMSRQSDAQVQAESISCLQQLHMFAPRHVELSSLVPTLCTLLSSWHLVLRRSAVSCLRQLAQKEAEEVCEIAARLSKPDSEENEFSVQITETGLEGALFKLLDLETDLRLRSDMKDTLNHVLQSTALKKLGFWLRLCKGVLASSTDSSGALGSVDAQQPDNNDDKEDEDDSETFTAGTEINKETKSKILPRWRTRVFAMQSVQKITMLCQQDTLNAAHFDLAKARSIIGNKDNHDDFLVLYLSDLVRMAFMAATDNNANLRMVGLDALQDVIKHFKDVPEPEFPGAVTLEQYQANVGAALRPAFAINADSSHEVTSRACEVCSAWLASAVVSDLNDLKRVHSLLVTSLNKIESNDSGSLLYSESASTMEKLAVLKAWAEVYIVAMETVQVSSTVLTKQSSRKQQDDSLLSLVKPHLSLLSKWWIKALRDHALLRLPREFNDHIPKEGGTFFTHESKGVVRGHFASSWPPIVHAAALWFQQTQSTEESNNEKDDNEMTTHLIIGICVETLCSPRSSENADVVIACLSALNAMLSTSQADQIIAKQQVLAVEILNVLHRLLLTRENPISQQIIMQVVKKITEACLTEMKGGDEEQGEGGENGLLIAGKSTVFAILEICMCVLVRQFPSINPTFRSKLGYRNKGKKLSKENISLVSSSLKILLDGLNLCSPKATNSVLPTVLILITGVLKEVSKHEKQADIAVLKTTILQCLSSIVKSPFVNEDDCSDVWVKIFRSTLATLLETSDDGDEDEGTLLMSASLFLLSSPSAVCKHPIIMKKMLTLFENCIMSNDPHVFSKCIQILPSIFQHKDEEIAHPFINRLSPKIVAKLLLLSESDEGQTSYAGVVESFKLLELLIAKSTQQHREEVTDVLMSVLVSFLLDEEDGRFSPDVLKMKTTIHDFALQHLIQVGQNHSEQFRNILQQQPHIKSKLEGAIRANQARTQQQQMIDQKERERQQKIESAKEKRTNPSIKLKMDFSNFSKK